MQSEGGVSAGGVGWKGWGCIRKRDRGGREIEGERERKRKRERERERERQVNKASQTVENNTKIIR